MVFRIVRRLAIAIIAGGVVTHAAPVMAQEWDEEGSGDEAQEPWTVDASRNAAQAKFYSYGEGEKILTLEVHCYFTNGSGLSHMDITVEENQADVHSDLRSNYRQLLDRDLARLVFIEVEGGARHRFRPESAYLEGSGAVHTLTMDFGAGDSVSAKSVRRAVSGADLITVWIGEDNFGAFTGEGSSRALSRLAC